MGGAAAGTGGAAAGTGGAAAGTGGAAAGTGGAAAGTGGAAAGTGGASAGSGGSSAGAGGSTAGAGGSSAGAGGSSAGSGGSGGSSSCTPPTGTTCTTAADYCSGYTYIVGNKVKAVCAVDTAGCIKGKNWLFSCSQAGCGSHPPGTTDGEGYWTITQCN